MCLDYTTKELVPETGIGYRIISKYKDEYRHGFIHNGFKCPNLISVLQKYSTKVRFNGWMTTRGVQKLRTEESNEFYPSGFHLYSSLRGIKHFVSVQGWTAGYDRIDLFIAKVEYSKPVAVGKQHGQKVLVVKKIKYNEADICPA